jgi:hypothetical protein
VLERGGGIGKMGSGGGSGSRSRKKMKKAVSRNYAFSNGRRQSGRRHRCAVGWAERASWAGREDEA